MNHPADQSLHVPWRWSRHIAMDKAVHGVGVIAATGIMTSIASTIGALGYVRTSFTHES
jgi:hypothetical protein